MFKKFKEHCGRPITWGKYYKLCGISFLMSFVFGIVYIGYWALNTRQYTRKF